MLKENSGCITSYVAGVRTIALVTGIVLAVAFPAAAQHLTSRVEGAVQDETGGFLPGASVTLTNANTGVAQETVTDERGLYVFPLVAEGTYGMTASVPGFTTTVVEDVRVGLNAATSVDFVVEIGQVTETVVVAASVAQSQLNTTNAELSTNIFREQVQDLPLNGRNVTQLALTQLGVTGPGGARSASFSGGRGTFNNFTLDGVNNQDTFIRTDSLFGEIPVRDSFIEEISITTGNADVDDGLGSSQAHFVTRSGGNSFDTEVFAYHRNEAFNANNFFNKAAGLEKERLREHEYGFNIGGPIVRDKAFFFFNYEEQLQPGTTSVVRTVLTDPARLGNFSYVRQDTGQLATVNLFDLAGASPDPAMQSLVASTPAANDTSVGDGRNTAGYRWNSLDESDSRWIVFRGDYVATPNHSLKGTFHRFTLDTPNSVFNGIGSVFPGLPGAGQGSRRNLASFGLTSTIGNGIVNEARFGFQGYRAFFETNETFPDGYDLDFGVFSNPVRDFLNQGRETRNLELNNSLTWVRGAHTLKFGGGARWTQVNAYNDAGLVPTYVLGFGVANPDPLLPGLFPGGISSEELGTASGLLAALGGYVDEVSQTFNVTSATSGFVPGATERRILTQDYFNFYAGDTWRVSADTSLTFGVRWELHTVPDETQGLALLPVGGVDAVLDPDAVVDFAGASHNRPFFNGDRNNFAPNIGVAHQLTDKLVLRAGYALNYVLDNNLTTVSNALSANDGLSQTVTRSGVGGTVSGGLAPVEAPEFNVPRTARDGILADPTAALFTIDPDMRTPYVQQWNVGVQYQLLDDTAVEVRYVGNRGTDLTGRSISTRSCCRRHSWRTSGARSGTSPPTGIPESASGCSCFRCSASAASCSRARFRDGFATARSGSTSAPSWPSTGCSSSTAREARDSAPGCRSASSSPTRIPSSATSSATMPSPSTTRCSSRSARPGAPGSPRSSTTRGATR